MPKTRAPTPLRLALEQYAQEVGAGSVSMTYAFRRTHFEQGWEKSWVIRRHGEDGWRGLLLEDCARLAHIDIDQDLRALMDISVRHMPSTRVEVGGVQYLVAKEKDQTKHIFYVDAGVINGEGINGFFDVPTHDDVINQATGFLVEKGLLLPQDLPSLSLSLQEVCIQKASQGPYPLWHTVLKDTSPQEQWAGYFKHDLLQHVSSAVSPKSKKI